MPEYDLHIHSIHSFDCLMEVAEIVRLAREKGLRGVAITDHGAIAGALEGEKLATDDFLVIPGVEISSKEGDVIGLFVRDVLFDPALAELPDPVTVADAIHAADGLVVLAHPCRGTLVKNPEFVSRLDAVEGFNARYNCDVSDVVYGDPDAVAFAREHDLPIIAGSDAHEYEEIGTGTTNIEADTLEDIKNAILRGHVLIATQKTDGVITKVKKKVRWFFSTDE